MSFKGTLDTNVILRFLLKDHKGHSRAAEEIIRQAREEGKIFFIPLTVVSELVFVLSRVYKLDRETVTKIVMSLCTLPAEIEKEEVVFQALELYRRGMKFSDALIYSQAVTEQRTPLYTFDRNDFKDFEGVVLLDWRYEGEL